MPSRWCVEDLRPWQMCSPFCTIGHLLPDWGLWNDDEEEALKLTDFELHMYQDKQYGHDVRCLDLEGTAATILHSYSNALGACPCGCRSKGFHILSLQKAGLRGFYVVSRRTGQPRFLHPREAGLLLGLPDSIKYVHSARTSLALLGLIASPLQVIWLFGHLRRNHALATSGQIQPKVEDLVRAFCLELLCQLTSTTSTRQSPASSMTMEAFGAPSQLLCPQDPFQSISCWWQSGSP